MKLQIIEIENIDGTITEHIFIENEDGSTLSMLKSIYDEQQAAMPKQEWVEPQLTKE